jgi:hypothetical protein
VKSPSLKSSGSPRLYDHGICGTIDDVQLRQVALPLSISPKRLEGCCPSSGKSGSLAVAAPSVRGILASLSGRHARQTPPDGFDCRRLERTLRRPRRARLGRVRRILCASALRHGPRNLRPPAGCGDVHARQSEPRRARGPRQSLGHLGDHGTEYRPNRLVDLGWRGNALDRRRGCRDRRHALRVLPVFVLGRRFSGLVAIQKEHRIDRGAGGARRRTSATASLGGLRCAAAVARGQACCAIAAVAGCRRVASGTRMPAIVTIAPITSIGIR